MADMIATWINEVKRYNNRLHLVSRSMEKDLEAQVKDTMGLLEHISEAEIGDLGAGSGFLAIPYKIMHPEANVFLIERGSKKCIFLRHVIDLLGLRNIEVTEADPLKQSIGPFSALMSRSFSPRESLEEAVARACASPGRFYYFSTGIQEPISRPGFKLQESLSEECKSYRLNLEIYII